MEKEVGKIQKNAESEIMIRIDDFGGNRGLTIREFVTSERYTGFTKAGVRIKTEDFPKFKEMINSITEEDMKEDLAAQPELKSEDEAPEEPKADEEAKEPKKETNNPDEEMPDY